MLNDLSQKDQELIQGVWDALITGCTLPLLLSLHSLLVAFVTISDGFFLKSQLISVSDMVTPAGEANESC